MAKKLGELQTKICTYCHKQKKISCFGTHSCGYRNNRPRAPVRQARCNECRSKISARKYAENRSARRARAAKLREVRRERNPILAWCERALYAARDRARAGKLDIDLTREDLHSLFLATQGYCPVCRIRFDLEHCVLSPDSPSLDRILVEFGYLLGNVQVMCTRCNSLKGGMTLEQARIFVAMMDEAQIRMYWIGPLESDEPTEVEYITTRED
jgi:hypothetical protein